MRSSASLLCVASALWAAPALMGCATPRLPYEARVWLMDAEEEHKTAEARVLEAREARVEAEAQVAEALRARDALGAESDVQPPLVEEAEAQVAYAEATLREKEQALELTEASRACSELGLAAARAEAEVRAKLEGAEPEQVKALHERTEACHGELGQLRALMSAASSMRSSAAAALERARTKAAAAAPTARPRPFLE